MSRLLFPTGPFPWEPEWQESLKKLRAEQAAKMQQKRKNDYILRQIAALMVPSAPVRRARGRPRVFHSIDYRRAEVVLKLQAALENLGRKASQKDIVHALQDLARTRPHVSPDFSLFPAGNLQSSVSRGMNEAKRHKVTILRGFEQE